MFHEWWGLPLFYLQTTSDVWHKIICKRFSRKKELKKTYHYMLKMCEDQSPLGDYCKYKVYFANLFLNYCKFERLNLNLLNLGFFFFSISIFGKEVPIITRRYDINMWARVKHPHEWHSPKERSASLTQTGGPIMLGVPHSLQGNSPRKVIRIVRRIVGETGQFWHNRASNP